MRIQRSSKPLLQIKNPLVSTTATKWIVEDLSHTSNEKYVLKMEMPEMLETYIECQHC